MSFIKKTIAAGKSTAPSPAAVPAGIPPPPGVPAPPGSPVAAAAAPAAPPPPAVTYACMAVQGQPYVVGEVNTIFVGFVNGKHTFAPAVGGASLPLGPADVVVPGAIPAHASAGLVPPPKPVASSAASDAVAAVGEAAAPARRGRKPKAVEASPACACGTALSPENSSNKDGKTTHIGCSGPAVGGAAPDGLHLYIGCIPSMQYTLLDDYVAERVAEVNKAFGLIDPRISQSNEDANAFGKWKALIGETVRQTPPGSGNFVAFALGSELTAAVVDALIPLCSTVVRGVR